MIIGKVSIKGIGKKSLSYNRSYLGLQASAALEISLHKVDFIERPYSSERVVPNQWLSRSEGINVAIKRQEEIGRFPTENKHNINI